MKYFTLIPAILLSLTSVNALASGYTCKTIIGTINRLIPDHACNILQSKPDHFPDVTFDGFPSCFTGNLTAKLGNTNVTGTAYSGITINGIGQLTAATAIRLNAGNISLGQIYTKDMIIFGPQGSTSEALTMVDGSKTFNGGYGGFEITGNALYETVSFTGMICAQN